MTSHQYVSDIDQLHCHCFKLARKPCLATAPFDNLNIVQCTIREDFLSFLIDGPFGGLETYRDGRFAHHQVERDEQWHPGSVQSYG